MELKLIPDEEIVLSQKNDLLGTSPYVQVIKKIIENNDGSLTVGLFGDWGSGKSSVVKSTIHNFSNKKNNFKTFYYDAWKFQDLAFKRKFILNFGKELGVDINKIIEKLYASIESKTDIGSINNNDWLIKLLLFGPLLLPLIAFAISFYRGEFSDLRAFVASIGVLSSILANIINEILKREYKKNKTYPIDSAEQFESLFNHIIKESEHSSSKFIIFIDEIDRCEPEIAKRILESTKNFLKHPQIIYFIPLDDKRLRGHLKMKDSQSNEFLRKIFDSSLMIRPYSNNELLKFACFLNDKYGLNLPIEALDICTSIYSKNPRRIINFINKIQIERYLVSLQEENEHIIKGQLSNNIAGLAKLLAIKEEWMDLFYLIQRNKEAYDDLNKIIPSSQVAFEFKGIKIDEEKLYFLKRTLDVSSEGFEFFFVNRMTFDRKIEGINHFLLDSKFEEIHKYLSLDNRSSIHKDRFSLEDLFYQMRETIIEANIKVNAKDKKVVFDFFINSISKDNLFEPFFTELSKPHYKPLRDLFLDSIIVSNYLIHYEKSILVKAIIKLGNAQKIDRFINNFLLKLLRQISLPCLDEEKELNLEAIRNDLYIEFKSGQIKGQSIFKEFLFDKINTKDNSSNKNVFNLDPIKLISIYLDSPKWKIFQNKDDILEKRNVIDFLKKEYFNIDEIIFLIKIFVNTPNQGIFNNSFSSFDFIMILLGRFNENDLNKCSHEIHHKPIIKFFEKIDKEIVDNTKKGIRIPESMYLEIETKLKVLGVFLKECKEFIKIKQQIEKKLKNTTSLNL